MAEILSLADAVKQFVNDGDTVALEGFTHLIPTAAGHEIIRQGKKDLTLVRMTPDLIYDQLIGAGCARKLIFSWGGNPGVGSLHRLRDAVEKQWPQPLEIEEHSHADLANAYVAGASGLPFAVLRAYAGSDLPKVNPLIKTVTCPFTGEVLAAVPSVRPDITVIHAQKADRKGNVLLWGILGVQKEAALAAKRCIVTVEEIVDDLNAPHERLRATDLGPDRRVPCTGGGARILPTPTVTPSVTIASIKPGIRSLGTVGRLPHGSMNTSMAPLTSVNSRPNWLPRRRPSNDLLDQ